MRIEAAHVPVHTRAEAEAIITQALEIAAESDNADVHQSIVFREACRLLGARASVVQGVSDGVPNLGALGLNTGHGL